MSITGLAIKRPILFIVFFLILGGLSIISYQNLKYELLPNLATPTITVITAYPGASPEDVENSVTKKIEDAVAGVSKSKKSIPYQQITFLSFPLNLWPMRIPTRLCRKYSVL
jgi:multidrug efflux pump subunit AcrB